MARITNTAVHLAASAQQTLDDTVCSILAQPEVLFLTYLRKHLPATSTTCHLKRRNLLLAYGRRFNLLPPAPARQGWDLVINAAEARRSRFIISSIAAYATEYGLPPADFSPCHLREWGQEQRERGGRGEDYIPRAEKIFRHTLRRGDLHQAFPLFDLTSRKLPPFSLFVKDMDEPLRADVTGLIEWARAQTAAGNLRIGESIVVQLEALCGYAVIVRNDMKGAASVEPMLTEGFLREYVDWLHRDRKNKRQSMHQKIAGLKTLLLFHPRFKNSDVSWWASLLDNVEREPKSVTDARREERSLPYEDHLAALRRMRTERLSAENLEPKDLAWKVRDELLMTLAVKLAWDPMLIRICRVDGPSPNLFKGPPMNRPDLEFTPSAKKALKANPRAMLWQFDFEKEWGAGAFGFVIRDAASLLDEYMSHHRGVLIGKHEDPGTLFFSRVLKPFSKMTLLIAIRRLTKKFAGKEVSPASIRVSFTDDWLIEHEKDYITLANILMVGLPYIQQRFDPDWQPQATRRR